jgi:hypothetical protein
MRQFLKLPIAKGPFVGTMDSLTNYGYPEWFRDAKFGIWAHWGPQAVPMEGRLVCAQDVSAGIGRLQRPSRALGPSVHQRLEGHHPAVEGRELGPGEN